MMDGEERGESSPIWVISRDSRYLDGYYKLLDDDLDIGFRNESDVTGETLDQYRARGGKVPVLDDLRYDKFVNTPRLRLPASFHPDYFYNKTEMFVSPKLFQLLDQPQGTLQGWPTDLTWVGPNPPDRTYLWLSYIPRVPTFDIARSTAEIDEYPNPDGGDPIIQLEGLEDLVVREDMVSPFGVFRASESTGVVLATDAVAEAVVRAGCTGIEFNEPETEYAIFGALRRRGPFGVELHPDGVEYRRINGVPVPER